MPRRLSPILLIAWLAGAAWGSPPPGDFISFQPVAVPDEVPAHLVTALAEDRQGFLWIGTQGGLVRYDGYQFKVFKFNPDDPRTLGGSYVRSLFAAADGRLWIGTFSGGVSVYDPATDTFTRYAHDPNDPGSLSHNRVETIAADRSGRIWIATYEGLDRLDPGTGRIEHFRHDDRDPTSLAADRVRAVLVDRSGRVWVGSQDGLQVYGRPGRGPGRGFERIASDPKDASSLARQFVSKLFEDDKGRIWIGTLDDGAAVLDPETGRLHRFRPEAGAANPGGLSHFWVYGIEKGADDEIWIATFGGGIDVVDARSLDIVARLRHDPALPNTIGSDRVGALFRDRSGLLWVGAWGQGLARHDPKARAFRALRSSPSRPEGLSHPEIVRALQMRDGTIWAGTNGNGIDLLDEDGRRIGGHRPDPEDPGALSDGAITCLAQGDDGTIWVGTLNGMLHRLRPGARRFERLSVAQGLPGGPIRALAFGPDGSLWAGAAEGLARIDPRTEKIATYRHRPDDPATLSGIAAESLAFDAHGTLWVGTDSGLNAFDPVRGTAVRISYQAGRRDGLPAGWIPDLMIARDGRLWVATPGGAAILVAWDGRTARFDPVAPHLGRPAAPVESLIEDDQGKVWLTPRLRVDPSSWTYQELGPADGLAFHDFFIASRSRTDSGTLLFGSPEGLLLVSPERLSPWTYEPPVVATAFRVDGVERPGASRLDRLTLAPGEKSFRLDFAALDFTAPARNRYRYRLEGFDDRWTAGDASQRSAAYTRLPPGRYTLRIEGTNRAGLVSRHSLLVPIEVLPAFYQTAWFRALAALGLIALAYAAYRLRVRRLEARGRALEQLVQERTLSLAETNQELTVAYRRIEEASLTDPLTRLRNRRFLDQGIESDLDLSARRHEDGHTGSGETDLAFLLLDLDHFKTVNDTYGHAAGDAVLSQTADLLRSTCRASDHLVRWGGEEFLLVARFCDRADAPTLAEKIRATIAAHPFRLDDGLEIRRTASIGFAVYPFAPAAPRAVGWQEIVAMADLALYAAKRRGRNRWVGVEAGTEGDPAETARSFREAPEAAIAEGRVTLRAMEDGEGGIGS